MRGLAVRHKVLDCIDLLHKQPPHPQPFSTGVPRAKGARFSSGDPHFTYMPFLSGTMAKQHPFTSPSAQSYQHIGIRLGQLSEGQQLLFVEQIRELSVFEASQHGKAYIGLPLLLYINHLGKFLSLY